MKKQNQMMREEGRPLCKSAAEVLPTLLLFSFFEIDFFSLFCNPSMILLNNLIVTVAISTFLVSHYLSSLRSI